MRFFVFPVCLLFPTIAHAAEKHDDLVVAGPEPAPPPPKSDPDKQGGRVQIAIGCTRAGARCADRDVDSDVAAVFGIRGSETLIERENPKAGVSLAIESLTYVLDRKAHTSGRVAHFAFLGGGRGGLEGGLGVDFGFGLTYPVGAHHGPFSRLGFRGELLGNSAFYASLVELPQLQLGYQVLGKRGHFELAARGGPVLAGRYNPDDTRRKLGGTFEYGGLMVLGVSAVNLDFGWTRIVAGENDPNGDLDLLIGMLCGGSGYFGVCMDTRTYLGDAKTARGPEAKRTVFLGLTLGAFTR